MEERVRARLLSKLLLIREDLKGIDEKVLGEVGEELGEIKRRVEGLVGRLIKGG